MASKIYNKAKQLLANGNIDLDAGLVYGALLMTNTTADTENDGIAEVFDLTTIDECDGSGYVRKELQNPVVNLDDGNDRAEFDADDLTWTTLGNGTRQLQGLLLYEDADDDGSTGTGDDAVNSIIAWIEFSSTINPGGATFTIQFNSEGILQFT